jgi:5'-methylthioadenosine phosphorylase
MLGLRLGCRRWWPSAHPTRRPVESGTPPARRAAGTTLREDQVAETAEIGVVGGSGFYSLLDDVREVKVDTPYGAPSDSVFLAEVGGRRVAFLPRHGRRHTIPPHRINYRANVWALRSLGVKAVISPCAAGSLQLHVKPGDFVVCDQFVDRTSGRADTFYDGPIVTHLSSAETYDPTLRRLAIETIREHGIEVHEHGTVVVIQGPRFSTKAESRWFSDAGWEVINMTQYPEAWLCRELGMAVVNISLITDYDAGVHEGTDAVDATSVLEVFQANAERIQRVVLDLIGRFPADLDALGARDALAPTRGDGHATSAEDIRLFETGL